MGCVMQGTPGYTPSLDCTRSDCPEHHRTCPDCGSTKYVPRPTNTAAVCVDCGGYFTLWSN